MGRAIGTDESETATTYGTGAQLTRSTALDMMMMMELLQ
jgi:hypothetical protein